MDSSRFWLWCKGKFLNDKTFNLVNVYGPNDLDYKASFWEDLSSIMMKLSSEPICFIGDFNSIRVKEDRYGCKYNKRHTVAFNLFMTEFGLIELSGDNYSFTWFGPANRKSKLDRVIVKDLWFQGSNWKVHG